jgi:hypothetical protein
MTHKTVHFSCIVLCLIEMCVLLLQLRFFRAFSSVVTQMQGYNYQSRVLPALPKLVLNFLIVMYVPNFFYCYVCSVLCILCVVCV